MKNIHGTSTDTTSMAEDDPGRKDKSQNVSLIKEQYEKLVNLL